MLDLARRAATNALCLGMTIGAMLVGTLPQGVAQATVQSPPVCVEAANPPPGAPPQLVGYVAFQCGLANALFADNLDPPTGYWIEVPPTELGLYGGEDAHGRAVSFEAMDVIPVAQADLNPSLFGPSDLVVMCFGWLTGPAGTVPVAGVYLKKPSITGDQDRGFFMVSTILRANDIPPPSFTEAERLSANAFTPATGSPGYAGPAPLHEGNCPTLDVACAKMAYATYKINDKAARHSLAACVALVMATFVTAMAACAALTLGTLGAGVGWRNDRLGCVRGFLCHRQAAES